MNTYHFLIVITFLLSFQTTALQAQAGCGNFNCKMDLARGAFEAGRYKEALDHARGAISYDRIREEEANKFIDKVFAEIEQKLKVAVRREGEARQAEESARQEKTNADFSRADAIRARSLADSLRDEAVKAQILAEKNARDAQIQAELARNAKDEATRQLKKFEELSAQIVNKEIEEVNKDILLMDYDKAQNKLIETLGYNNQTLEFRRATAEIAFWLNETKASAKAAQLLKKVTGAKLKEDYFIIIDFLAAYDSTWYKTLQERYYGNLIAVDGGTVKMNNKVKAEVSNFKMSQTEVTFWQFGIYCANNKKSLYDYQEPEWSHFEGHHPIINVSWNDAISYLNWRSQRPKQRLDPVYKTTSTDLIIIEKSANGYRLPTETEWEFAAKGGKMQQNFRFAGSNNFGDVATQILPRTYPVRFKDPNTLGFYDLTGNVWEWCSDWNGTYPKLPGKNFLQTYESDRKIIRGGGNLGKIPLIKRDAAKTGATRNDLGFRIAQNGQ